MPDIEISKIKARRGTDSQRKTISLDQGELGYTIDTKRLFIGDGVTLGGNVIGSKVHPPLTNYFSLSNVNAQVGDIVAVDKVFYQLISEDYTNLNNWTNFRLNIDPTVFSFDSDNTLFLNQSSINASYLNPSTISNGLKISSGILQCDFQTKSLEISSYKLSLKSSGIDEREISSSTFINGLSGGSGNKIGIKSNPNYFYYDSTGLNLSGFNPFILKFSDLKSSWFGSGLVYNSTLSSLSSYITDIDSSNTLVRASNGKIGINTSIFGSGLYFNTGTQTLSTTITNIDTSNTLVKSSDGKIGINTSIFGSGLYFNTGTQTLSTNIVDVDNVSLLRNSNGTIKIKDDVSPSTSLLAKTTVDQFGRVTSQTTSIYGTLTGNNTNNSSNSLSSIFNGSPSQLITGAIPGVNLTRFTAISSNGTSSVTVTLSSAGFITFEGPTTTQTGQTIGRFAIPIFAY